MTKRACICELKFILKFYYKPCFYDDVIVRIKILFSFCTSKFVLIILLKKTLVNKSFKLYSLYMIHL